ncbi:ABC-type phosphate transport system substrate-binding protein [Curtobacterium sp. SORGH_AS776]|nr:ABC-type phosphate transport system substrate-binding protein [Curtobacterium sp. SORGH_AS_0776]
MNIKRIGTVAAIAIAGAVVLSSCAANEDAGNTPSSSSSSGTDYSKLSGTLTGSGSSAQQTAEATWAAGFQNVASGVTVNYSPDGSGAGRKNFISGAADFAGSDAALKDEELAGSFALCAADSKAIDIPVYISPIAIAYKVDGVKDLTLDAKTIAGIFSGKITKWNDSQIADLNKDATLPDANITVVHRSDDSGTTQNFSEYVAANAKDVWTEAPSQTFPYQVGDSAKGTSGVASAMASASNAITYIDDSGAGDLDKAKLMVGDKATEISAEGAAKVVADSETVLRPRGQRPRDRHQPHRHGRERLAAGARLLRDRLPGVQGRRQGQAREGLPRLRRLEGRAGRRREGGQVGRPLDRPRREGREGRRLHQVRHPERPDAGPTHLTGVRALAGPLHAPSGPRTTGHPRPVASPGVPPTGVP